MPMATTEAYLAFVLQQLEGISGISSKKMFGEYLVYCNGKPVLTVCDNTVFVKKLPEIAALLQGAPEDAPYPGAKPQFILDIEDQTLVRRVVSILEEIVPLPKKRSKKKADGCG